MNQREPSKNVFHLILSHCDNFFQALNHANNFFHPDFAAKSSKGFFYKSASEEFSNYWIPRKSHAEILIMDQLAQLSLACPKQTRKAL